MKQNVYKNTTDYILCQPTIPGHGLCPDVQLMYLMRLHWRKRNFLSACRYHLQISSWMGVRAHAHFLLSMLRPHLARSCAGLVHVLTISGCSYAHLPLVSGKHCFLENILHLWFLNFTASYSSWILERRGLMKISCLVLSVLKSLPLYTLSSQRLLYSFPYMMWVE